MDFSHCISSVYQLLVKAINNKENYNILKQKAEFLLDKSLIIELLTAIGTKLEFRFNATLRGDYTLLLSNFVLDITFKQIH